MFDFIRNNFNIGDLITLHCNNGTYSGTIKFINDVSIILILKDGRLCGIKGEDINFFEQIDNNTDDKMEKESSNPTIVDSSVENKNVEEIEQLDGLKPSNKIQPSTKYKVGDVIPLEELKRIDPNYSRRRPHDTLNNIVASDTVVDNNKALSKQIMSDSSSSTSKEKKKKNITLRGDFSALAVLVEDEHQKENQKIVPAFGEITYFNIERNFGFIKNNLNKTNIYFSLNQIIDKELRNKLSEHTAVVYSIEHFPSGDQAWYVHRPLKIADLLIMAKNLSNEGNYKSGLAIIDHILNEYPDNFDADALKKTIIRNIPSSHKYGRDSSSLYAQAKQCHINKEYDRAIELYSQSILENDRVESAIKDVASIYTTIYKSEEGTIDQDKTRLKAIRFLKDNVSKLSNTLSTLNFLEGVYYSLKDYENFHNVIDNLLEEPSIKRNRKQWQILMTKKAAALVHERNFDEALEIIEDCLRQDPNNITAKRLKSIIDDGFNESDDIESIISATEFESLSMGLSPFIQETLDSYTEYFGIPAKVIEAEDFNKLSLLGIRKLIENVGRTRARERAKYLLTEGKLMLELEPDNVVKLRTEMARYCISMAFNHISEYNSMDIVRFYYNEAFALEENYNEIKSQVTNYLSTHIYTNKDLMSATTSKLSLNKALDVIVSKDFDTKKWDSILSMILYNREISAQIVSKLYSERKYREIAIKALKYFEVEVSNNCSQEQFVEAWNNARDIRLRSYKQSVTSIKTIADVSSIEELTFALYNLQNQKKEWFCSLDTNRINSIVRNIAPAIDNYIKSSGYRNKESNYNNSQGQIQQLLDEIKEGPTKLSFEGIMPLLKTVQEMLKNSFADVVKASAPKITISLLSSANVIEENNTISLQILISNHKDSSPIREVSVLIESSKDVEYIPSENLSSNAIEGGDSQIFKLQVKVGPNVIKNKATAINAVCNYKNGDETVQQRALLSLKLYSPDEFKPIENPYSPLADGGPVPVESEMFYGREDFIANIVESIVKSPSKQIIIYGQKRCGKSSVMLHLKEQLQKTGKTFCIFFSLGDIIQNLTEAAFYHKILSSIESELEGLQFNKVVVPSFSVPKMSEFKAEDEDNPLNTFTNYMMRFKRACKITPGWEEKNLVVMIDEFTYLYTEIKEGHISPSLMKQWKAVTQNERAQFSVVLVGQDVVPSFKKEDYARNAFGVIQDIRLTYLQEEPAKDLIEKPILNEDGSSRYIGAAVNRIIEYTSRNPYYIQIFCSRLVDYMNRNKSITVTEADVNEVAHSFIVGDQALEEDKFDNLIRAGEKEDLQEYPEREIRTVLREIAIASKNVGFCNRSDLNALEDRKREDDILKHLVDREVLEKRGEETYKIQVKLFQEWLLNH